MTSIKHRTFSMERAPPWLWSLVALLGLWAYDLAFIDDFFAIEVRNGNLYGRMVEVLDQAAPVMLLSLGMTLVIATGGVDLSVGTVVAIAGALAAQILAEDWAAPFAMLLPVCICLGLGLVNGGLVAWIGVQPIVATLILMVSGRGIAQLITDGQTIPIQNQAFSFVGNGHLLGLPFSLTVVVCLAVLAAALVRLSAMGLFIAAVGNNEVASHYAGVNVGAVKLFAYGFSGMCAGVAGLLKAADIRSADPATAGMYMELDAILATVLGGTSLAGGRFSLIGSLIGALIIQTLTTTILASNVPIEYTLIVKALVVLAVCLLQSREFRGILVGRRVSP